MALVILERISKKLHLLLSLLENKELNQGYEVVLSQFLNSKNIIFLKEKERDKVIDELVCFACDTYLISDRTKLYNAVVEREKIISTGIGKGVAIPHAKLEVLNDFHFCIGIQLETGLEWNSLDGNLVRIVFLILGPSSDQKTYLQLLSEITAMVKKEEFSFEIFKGKTAFELAQLFQQLEKK